jgi:uncharacterized membrane protein YhaH (DUF805 family)
MFWIVLLLITIIFLFLYINDYYKSLKVNKEFFDECCYNMELIYENTLEKEYNQSFMD